jgi:hypothetical protein
MKFPREAIELHVQMQRRENRYITPLHVPPMQTYGEPGRPLTLKPEDTIYEGHSR